MRWKIYKGRHAGHTTLLLFNANISLPISMTIPLLYYFQMQHPQQPGWYLDYICGYTVAVVLPIREEHCREKQTPNHLERI